MEEKKLDFNSILGFVLIFGILIYMFYINQPTAEELAEKQKQELVYTTAAPAETSNQVVESTSSNSAVAVINQIGDFKLADTNAGESVLSNDKMSLVISHKGGSLSSVLLDEYQTYDSLPLYLVKDNNAQFNIELMDRENRIINTSDLLFEPVSVSASQVVLRSNVSESQYIEFVYGLENGANMLDFSVRTVGLSSVLNASKEAQLVWAQKARRNSMSVTYENRYTQLTYLHQGDKVSELSATSEDEENEQDIKWISYRQHFFSSILIPQTPFAQATLQSENFVTEESKEAEFTKGYQTSVSVPYTAGELALQLKWYYGPTSVKELSKYEDLDLESSIPFGWGIFGWINRYVFTPTYGFLSSFLPFGIAIIVMTILVRILMSPVTYKSYVSQAKMKVLKPEIEEINTKYKDNAMKKQQETMALYSKAGVSPMSGCVPALLQLPIFYALFSFFPTAFVLRQKSFLWADDLSSYDSIAQLPFKIPFYGDHVSLFPILASVAIFFYMKMTTGQNMPTQPGMPNMKFILYLSPLMMLFFFNSYASGLSLYYFVSNLITIVIMLVIKTYILDEDKIHAKIQVNKQKPKKQSKFQQKMKEMMEQAEAQQKKK